MYMMCFACYTSTLPSHEQRHLPSTISHCRQPTSYVLTTTVCHEQSGLANARDHGQELAFLGGNSGSSAEATVLGTFFYPRLLLLYVPLKKLQQTEDATRTSGQSAHKVTTTLRLLGCGILLAERVHVTGVWSRDCCMIMQMN